MDFLQTPMPFTRMRNYLKVHQTPPSLLTSFLTFWAATKFPSLSGVPKEEEEGCLPFFMWFFLIHWQYDRLHLYLGWCVIIACGCPLRNFGVQDIFLRLLPQNMSLIRGPCISRRQEEHLIASIHNYLHPAQPPPLWLWTEANLFPQTPLLPPPSRVCFDSFPGTETFLE